MPFINDPQGREEVEKVSRRLKLPVWKSYCKGDFRKWWNEWWDKIDTFAEEIEAIEIKAGTGLEGGGNLTKNRTLDLKKATKTELGGIIVGDNLTVDSNGKLSGNAAVDISGKMDKYQNVIDEKINYDDIAADGFYIARGIAQGGINAPFNDQALVQVWRYAGFVRQEAVSYYSAGQTACRIFSYNVKNTPWVFNYNAENLKPAEIITTFAKGNVGLSGNISYIQTAGTKTSGNLYYDNSSTPAKPYLCVNTTTDITPTSNFISANNAELTNRIKTIMGQSSISAVSTNGNTTLNFIKIGRVVQVYISTKGGSISNQFTTVLPANMRPASTVYLGAPSISGSPFLAITATGSIIGNDNYATMHTVSTYATTYFLTQNYISNSY